MKSKILDSAECSWLTYYYSELKILTLPSNLGSRTSCFMDNRFLISAVSFFVDKLEDTAENLFRVRLPSF